MLHGFDISHHNGDNAVNKLIKEYPDKCDFFILKATEGTNYKDPQFKKFASDVVEKEKLLGAYHFCRADRYNSPESEAENFYEAVKPFLGICMLVADFEGASLARGESWLYNFVECVRLKTGVKPLVYIQASAVKNQPFTTISKNDNGLWIAKWGKKPDNVKPWDFYAMWQYTNKFNGAYLDANWFNGDENQFSAYCRSEYADTNSIDCHCGCSYCCHD